MSTYIHTVQTNRRETIQGRQNQVPGPDRKSDAAHLGAFVWIELRGVRPTGRVKPTMRLVELARGAGGKMIYDIKGVSGCFVQGGR